MMMAPVNFFVSSVDKEQLPLLIVTGLFVVLISTQIGTIARLASVTVSRWYLHTFVLNNSKKAPISSTTITRLYTYPVKSLRAIECESAILDEKGFVGDRRLMLVTEAPTPRWGSFGPKDATHRFLTQRQCPSLATVIVKQQDTTITLSSHVFPNRRVTVCTTPKPGNPKYRSSLWSDIVLVQDLGDTAASFLKDIVQQDESVAEEYKSNDVRLVIQCPEDDRSADAKYVPASARTRRGNKSPAVALSDGFPILLANEASLKELNKRLKEKGKKPLKMSNFRPNIVVKGKEPFEEDRWKVIRIGSAVFHVVKGCPRCKLSCTDQITGIVSEEPLETLAEFRAMTSNPDNLYFAQNVLPASDNPKGYAIRKGDKVEVLQVGEPVWDD